MWRVTVFFLIVFGLTCPFVSGAEAESPARKSEMEELRERLLSLERQVAELKNHLAGRPTVATDIPDGGCRDTTQPAPASTRMLASATEVLPVGLLAPARLAEPKPQAPAVSQARTDSPTQGSPAGPVTPATPAPAAGSGAASTFKPAPSEPPKRVVSVGRGALEFSGLFQAWYQNTRLEGEGSRVRRVEVRMNGQIVGPVGYSVMIDSAQSRPNEFLQDAYLTFKLIPRHVINVGLSKIPFGMEGWGSSSALDFPERAIVSGASFRGSRGYGDLHDKGVRLDGQWSSKLNYWVGVYNGERFDQLDKNNKKDVIERVVFKPVRWLQFGGSRYDGSFGGENNMRKRTGGELAFLFGNAFLKTEYIRARDGAVRAEGWYGSAGYRFRGLQIGGTRVDFQPALRYEAFNPDVTLKFKTIKGPTAGLNILFDDRFAKIQIGYTHFTLQGRDENRLIAGFQVAF